MKTEQPYRPTRIRATFETWRAMMPIHGTFTIEIRLTEQGHRSIYRAFVMPNLQKFERTFNLSSLPECKSYVESQFQRKLSDWIEL